MIIKELIDCGKRTQNRLRALTTAGVSDTAELELLRCKMAALKELQSYVYNGNWTRKASREKYIALVKSKFDYDLTAKRFNTTRECLDVFAFRQNKRLKDTIGKALQLIEQDCIEEGLSHFYSEAGLFSMKEFAYRVSELLPKGSQKDSFLVSNCAEEVAILRFLLKDNLQEWLNRADREKLSYLVFLLTTDDDTFRKQKAELIGRLRKKDS